MAGDRGVQAAAKDGREGCRSPLSLLWPPVLVEATLPEQPLDEDGFSPEPAAVFSSCRDEKRSLRRTEVGTVIGECVDLEAQAVPRPVAERGVPAIELMMRAGQAVEGIRQPGVATVNLVMRPGFLLCRSRESDPPRNAMKINFRKRNFASLGCLTGVYVLGGLDVQKEESELCIGPEDSPDFRSSYIFGI